MSELVKGSTELSKDTATADAANLLRHYSFDLDDCTIDQLFAYWLETYPANWVRLAIIEALYQGRYKAISVEQILALWKRRQQPLYHFNHEFERLVSDRFPRNLMELGEEPPTTRTILRDTGIFSFPSNPPLNHSDSSEITSIPGSAAPTLTPSATGDELAEAAIEAIQSPSSTPAEDATPPPLIGSSDLSATDKPVVVEKNVAQEEFFSSELTSESGAVPPTLSSLISEHSSVQAASTSETASDSKTINSVSVLRLAGTQILIPGLGLNTPALKPKLRLHLATLYQPNWAIGFASHHPIDRFTPKATASSFYSKLRAVVHPDEERSEG